MKNFTKAYRELCFEFFDATGICNNALRRLSMCKEARLLLDVQSRRINECGTKLRKLQREEMGEKLE